MKITLPEWINQEKRNEKTVENLKWELVEERLAKEEALARNAALKEENKKLSDKIREIKIYGTFVVLFVVAMVMIDIITSIRLMELIMQ
jgi:hypothetical protein|nr:MAG TPA: hypothetical protein [Caudoviricetes sp.]